MKSTIVAWVLVLTAFAFPSTVSAQATNLVVTKSELTRAVQIATSVRKLTVNKVNALRDQTWLSFMVELYKRNPDASADAVAAAYARYTDAFNQLSSAAAFPAGFSNPSSEELYNLIIANASQIPGTGPYVPYALAAVRQAVALQEQANSVLNQAISNSQFFTDTALQTTMGRLDATLLSPSAWHGLVDGALGLADANPVFRSAYRNVITPLTQIAPGDSLETMIQSVQEIANDATISKVLSHLDTNGLLQMTTGDAVSLFQDAMGQLNQTISDNVSVINQIVSRQSDLLNYVADPGLFDQLHDLQTAVQNDASGVIQGSGAAFDLLGTLVGQADQSLGAQISAFGQSATQIADAVNVMDIADLAGSLASSASIVGAVMDIGSLFGGGGPFGGGGSDKEILNQLGQLQNEIQSLHQDMDARFNQVDQALNKIYSQMETGFALITSNLNVNFGSIEASLFTQQEDLHFLESELNAWLGQGYLDAGLITGINTYLGEEARTGIPMAYHPDYDHDAEPAFFTWAINWSLNPVYNITYNPNPGTAFALLGQLKGRPLDILLNCLDGFLVTNRNVASIVVDTLPSLPNPRIWAMSANAYARLNYENPGLFRRFSAQTEGAARLSSIISVGQQLQASLANLTYTNDGLHMGVNWPLWDSAFAFYREQISAFAGQLKTNASSYGASHGLRSSGDPLRETNYVTVISGSNVTGGGPTRDGTNATFNLMGWKGIFPTTDGIVGIDGYTDSEFNFVGRHVSANGLAPTVSSDPPLPYTPRIDGQLGLSTISLNGSAATRDGSIYVTYYLNNYHQGLWSPSVARVDRDPESLFDQSALTTVYGYNPLDSSIWGTLSFVEPTLTAAGPDGSLYVYDIGTGWLDLIDADGNESRLNLLWQTAPSTASIHFAADNQACYAAWVVNTNIASPSPHTLSYTYVERIPKDGSPATITTNLTRGAFGVYLNPSVSAIAIGPNGRLWLASSDSSVQTQTLIFMDPPFSGGGIVYAWQGALDQSSAPEAGILPDLAIGGSGSGYLGGFQIFGMCVDEWNNLYIADGRYVMRVGGDIPLQLGAYQALLQELQTDGSALHSAALSLDGAKELLKDLVALGLSQSFDQDDLLRSFFTGTDGLLDNATALTLITNNMTGLTTAPIPPLNLAAVASNRIDALERQVKFHLLEVDSRTKSPTDSLALDLVFTTNSSLDDSPLAQSVLPLGAPAFQASAAVGRESLAGNNLTSSLLNGIMVPGGQSDWGFGSNSDFTLEFWTTSSLSNSIVIGNRTDTKASYPGWWIGVDSAGNFAGRFISDNGLNLNFALPLHLATGGSLSNHLSHQCAIVLSRTAGLVSYFIDGALSGRASLDGSQGGFGAGDLYAGGFLNSNSSPSSYALLDGFSVWTRALGSAEIAALYKNGVLGVGVIGGSNGFRRNPSPAEPLSMVHTTLEDLLLLHSLQNSPPPMPRLSERLDATNGLRLVLYGEPGLDYVLESSTTLFNWTALTNVVKEGVETAVETSKSSAQFFRAIAAE